MSTVPWMKRKHGMPESELEWYSHNTYRHDQEQFVTRTVDNLELMMRSNSVDPEGVHNALLKDLNAGDDPNYYGNALRIHREQKTTLSALMLGMLSKELLKPGDAMIRKSVAGCGFPGKADGDLYNRFRGAPTTLTHEDAVTMVNGESLRCLPLLQALCIVIEYGGSPLDVRPDEWVRAGRPPPPPQLEIENMWQKAGAAGSSIERALARGFERRQQLRVLVAHAFVDSAPGGRGAALVDYSDLVEEVLSWSPLLTNRITGLEAYVLAVRKRKRGVKRHLSSEHGPASAAATQDAGRQARGCLVC